MDARLRVASRASITTDPVGPGPVARSTSSATNAGCDSESTTAAGAKGRKHYPQPLRRIKYYDAGTGKTFNFLTNHFAVSASTVQNSIDFFKLFPTPITIYRI